ncbi:MAG: DUF2255 family protein [Gammaproteobacteria bacterium]|nr:DUF2255 family protein [Gammaproteobacteria bacterium]
MPWSQEELRQIVEADDLHVSPFREDDASYGTPTWIWSVAVDDALYVPARVLSHKPHRLAYEHQIETGNGKGAG